MYCIKIDWNDFSSIVSSKSRLERSTFREQGIAFFGYDMGRRSFERSLTSYRDPLEFGLPAAIIPQVAQDFMDILYPEQFEAPDRNITGFHQDRIATRWATHGIDPHLFEVIFYVWQTGTPSLFSVVDSHCHVY